MLSVLNKLEHVLKMNQDKIRVDKQALCNNQAKISVISHCSQHKGNFKQPADRNRLSNGFYH